MSEMLTAVSIIFIVAGPFLFLANRYRLPAAPFLIISGIVAGLFIDEAIALELAQFGIALLVFTFGVGIQLSNFKAVIADAEITALTQILIVGLLGFGLGIILGVSQQDAIFLGVAAALSSTIVATALLETQIRTNLVYGRLGESIQFVQDLVAIGFILVLSAGVIELDPIVLQIGYGLLFVVAAAMINRYGFDFIGKLAGDSDELIIVGVIALLVVFLGASVAVDVPIVVGAFAAGLAVRYDPEEYLGLFNGLASIKDFFLAIFFTVVGALVVLPFIHLETGLSIEKLVIVGGLVFLTVIVKPALTVAILIYRGYESRTATLTGLSTDQVSEFSIIIAIQALLVGMLSQTIFDAIILAAAVTMITSTVSQRYIEEIHQGLRSRGFLPGRHEKIDELSNVPADVEDHVIVLGYGRAGRQLVSSLEKHQNPYVVVENDPAVFEIIGAECDAFVLGDAMEEYTLEKARANNARVIVSMTGSPTVSRQLLAADYDTNLVLRAEDERLAVELLDAGATYVAVPDLLAGEELVTKLQALFDESISPDELRSQGMDELGNELLTAHGDGR